MSIEDKIDILLSKVELNEEERLFLKENISRIKWYLSQQDIEKIYGYKDIVHSHDIDRSKPRG